MPSMDVVSTVDMQEVDNAINNTTKEVATRYDFRGVETTINLNRKDKKLVLETGDDMKLKALKDMLVAHLVRRSVDPKSLEYKEPEAASGGRLRQEAVIQEGIEKSKAQAIVKAIKATKLKVQPAIQDEQVRVTGKKIDDLQEVIQLLKDQDFGVPLQFVNMKR
ncbi:YajQ family cyclic di-GMP-binding protein [Oceanidesulfovibrio marinus]|uniref:Nucleotide-binding protein DQK91_17750 n=1 Tax=Oceanidesulfovibrio marinus TaxID=370038 RepID=A0A6P1ZDF2_9BACT|nr:YajQ family cyclic di-GMP-binding protein [Oceanidesulfovibrio marinus]QJT11041.1 YajQ family cyclic di-GMP-binding protein [Oceanidesulfovibrio marinus]TVM31776.1 YajQ family cyclic di-GMP-binding protein [Oceanidesulfovibrio marinus]